MLCAAENPWGASWGADGTILFGQGPKGYLRSPTAEGRPRLSFLLIRRRSPHMGRRCFLAGRRYCLPSLLSGAIQRRHRRLGITLRSWFSRSTQGSGRSSCRAALTPAMCQPGISSTFGRDAFCGPIRPVGLVTTGNPTPVADGIRQADSTVSGVSGGGGATGAAHRRLAEEPAVSSAGADVAMMTVPIESGPGFTTRQSNQTVLRSVLRRRERPHVRCHG